MVQFQFVSFVQDLFDYYERKRPNDNTMDLWFHEVKNIPDECLSWIKVKIFKENESKPSNLPATMWALYNAWLQANPQKRAFTEEKNCPDCEGGWIILEKYEEMYGRKTSYSAACGKCKQIPSAHYMTLNQALANGYERKNLKAAPWDGKSVNQMIGDITKREVPAPKAFAD